MALSFTPATRNLDLGILVVSQTSGTSVDADQYVADIVNAYPVLETQAKQAIGAKVWADAVAPLVSIA
jgi:hypothetical protein